MDTLDRIWLLQPFLLFCMLCRRAQTLGLMLGDLILHHLGMNVDRGPFNEDFLLVVCVATTHCRWNSTFNVEAINHSML